MAIPWHFACLLMIMDRGIKGCLLTINDYVLLLSLGEFYPIGKIINIINSDTIILFGYMYDSASM